MRARRRYAARPYRTRRSAGLRCERTGPLSPAQPSRPEDVPIAGGKIACHLALGLAGGDRRAGQCCERDRATRAAALGRRDDSVGLPASPAVLIDVCIVCLPGIMAQTPQAADRPVTQARNVGEGARCYFC
jgi:hypothetical protein